MRKLFAFIAVSILCFNLHANNNTSSIQKHLLDGEEVIVTPDTIHLYYHGCSPHGEYVTITNNTSHVLVIDRFYSDIYNVECLFEGINVNEEGMFVSAGETIELQVFVSILGKDELDSYGNLFIDTDLGVFTVTIFHETYLGLQENPIALEVYPNPADNQLTLKAAYSGKVTIYNALGQLVDEFSPDKEETVIQSAHYPNGIYFLKTEQGKTKCFIVNH